MSKEKKITHGSNPTHCHVCGKPAKHKTPFIMGQMYFGLCDEHKDYKSYMGKDEGGMFMGLKKPGK